MPRHNCWVVLYKQFKALGAMARQSLGGPPLEASSSPNHDKLLIIRQL